MGHQYNYSGVTLDEYLNVKTKFNNIFKRFSHKIDQFGKAKSRVL